MVYLLIKNCLLTHIFVFFCSIIYLEFHFNFASFFPNYDSFNPKEITHIMDGSKEQTKLRHALGKLINNVYQNLICFRGFFINMFCFVLDLHKKFLQQ